MREYRLMRIEKDDLYYPQVREKKFLFRTKWRRIGVHPDGFGLYPANNFSYGVDWGKAKKIIRDYEKQFLETDPPYVYSIDSQESVRYDIKRETILQEQNNALNKCQ